jgi:hypothetical protein
MPNCYALWLLSLNRACARHHDDCDPGHGDSGQFGGLLTYGNAADGMAALPRLGRGAVPLLPRWPTQRSTLRLWAAGPEEGRTRFSVYRPSKRRLEAVVEPKAYVLGDPEPSTPFFQSSPGNGPASRRTTTATSGQRPRPALTILTSPAFTRSRMPSLTCHRSNSQSLRNLRSIRTTSGFSLGATKSTCCPVRPSRYQMATERRDALRERAAACVSQ